MLLLTVTEFRNNMSKYLHMAFTEKIALKSKEGIIMLTPNKELHTNPSPGLDPWFDNPQNLEELERRIADIKSGKTELTTWDEIKANLGL